MTEEEKKKQARKRLFNVIDGDLVGQDEEIIEYFQSVQKQKDRMTPQEAGRATYKSETPAKDGTINQIKFDKQQLIKAIEKGFKEMEEEKQI